MCIVCYTNLAQFGGSSSFSLSLISVCPRRAEFGVARWQQWYITRYYFPRVLIKILIVLLPCSQFQSICSSAFNKEQVLPWKRTPALCTHICLQPGQLVLLVNYSPTLKEYSFTYCRSNLSASCPLNGCGSLSVIEGPFPRCVLARAVFTVCGRLNDLAQQLCWWIKACYDGWSILPSVRHIALQHINHLFWWEAELLKGKLWLTTTCGVFL